MASKIKNRLTFTMTGALLTGGLLLGTGCSNPVSVNPTPMPPVDEPAPEAKPDSKPDSTPLPKIDKVLIRPPIMNPIPVTMEPASAPASKKVDKKKTESGKKVDDSIKKLKEPPAPTMNPIP